MYLDLLPELPSRNYQSYYRSLDIVDRPLFACGADRPGDEGRLHALACCVALRPDEHGPLPATASSSSAHSYSTWVSYPYCTPLGLCIFSFPYWGPF